jgi:hypothetical protein
MHPLAGGSFVFAALSGNAQVSPRLSNHTDRSAWDAWTQGLPFAPHGPTDPCGSLLKHLAAEHADLATVYRQLPSLLRRSVEGELVPDRHIFQSRVQDDPIRYQDLGWRWALILELNLPEAIQEPFRLDMALNQSLSSSLEKVTARLQALGAETYLLAERPPFWATGREKQGLLRGAITQTRTIAPGASAHMTFLLTWFYPNHRGENVGDTLGHRYTIWFEDALDVANYVATQRDQLYRRSKAFHDAQYTATAPYWLIDAINAQLTTLSKSSWYVRDGRFAIWEGLGCCGLQTLDVAYYGSQPIALCFPELERRQLQMTADFQLTPQSPHYDEYFLAFPANRKLVQQRVAERPELALDPDLRLAMYREIVAETGLDASGRIPHFFPATFADIDSYHMIDLMPKFALLVLRDYQWTGDLEALQRLWPHVKAAMQHTRQLDALAVGLPYHYDHAPEETIISAQTYATWDFIGYSAYVSGIWLAALKATARMARIMEDQAYAAVLEQDFLRGQASMEQLLWNGEYYDLWYDPASGLRNQCCMAGQISGQFYASLLGLGDILPADHQLAALRAIFSHNRIQGRGLLNGVLPIGRRADKPKNWTLGDPRLQSDTVWSGTEYAVAVQMIQTGLVDEGLTIIREVYERYERAGQTWDHQECGGHYYRAMIVWLAWQALGGIHYAAPGQSLRLRPVAFNSEGYWKQPLVLPGFWGTCTCAQQERRCSINVQEGTLALKQLVLPGETATASAWLAGNQIEAQLAHDTLCFPQGIILTAGQTLELRW